MPTSVPGEGSTPAEWLVLVVLPLVGLAMATGGLIALGRPVRWPLPVAALARGLRRTTGLPGWTAAGVLLALWALLVAVAGFMWDVAWHADLGRDRSLLTPAHTMILMGLVGIGGAAAVTVVLASAERAAVGPLRGRVRIPWSILPLVVLALAALAGFPLDDMWHAAYGIDVTLWSPTHILMVGAASLTPVVLWLLLVEGGPGERPDIHRLISVVLAVAVMLGASTFQDEFDMGIPQWQMLFHPVLVASAAALTLTVARAALGRGGALLAAAGFLLARLGLAVFVGGILGRTMPHFPLYLGTALAVEAAWLAGRRLGPVALGLLAGILSGTLGLAVEWGWSQAWSYQSWQTSLLPRMWVPLLAAVAAAVLGVAAGSVLGGRRPLPAAPAVAVAALGLAGLLAVPWSRGAPDATATVTTRALGPARPTVDRDGYAALEQDALVSVRYAPGSTGNGADLLEAISWQGGGVVRRPLVPMGGGGYRAAGPVPTGGRWKSMVLLDRGDEVTAVPVAMPRDRDYQLPAIPLVPERTVAVRPSTEYLMREFHGGTGLIAVLAEGGLLLAAVLWLITVAIAFVRVARDPSGRPSSRGQARERVPFVAARG